MSKVDQGQKRPTMPRKPAHKPDDPAQVKRFIEAAKSVGVDESPGAFEKALKKVAPPKTKIKTST